MTKNSYFGLSAILLGVAFGLPNQVSAGPVRMRFEAIKDIGIYGFEGNGTDPSEQLQSAGDAGAVRAMKANQQVMLMDFDTTAMADFLQANPGNATWTLNILPFDNVNTSSDIEVLTVESTNDWAEGDSPGINNLGWTTGTASATYFYAQTFHAAGVLDITNSLEWADPDSGPYTFTTRIPNYTELGVPVTVGGGDTTSADDPTPEFLNSNVFTPQALLDAIGSEHASVVLDAPIVDALLNDQDNRGLRFGPLVNSEFSNWRVFDRENDFDINGDLKDQVEWLGPYLEVTITAGSQTGDFDSDGDVDGEDFLVWQRNTSVGSLTDWQGSFGTGNAVVVVSSVPEPGRLLLAANAFLIVASRRKK